MLVLYDWYQLCTFKKSPLSKGTVDHFIGLFQKALVNFWPCSLFLPNSPISSKSALIIKGSFAISFEFANVRQIYLFHQNGYFVFATS